MVLDLRSDLFEHVQRLSLTFHDQRETGALMSQINMQAASVGNIVMVVPPIFEAALTLVGMLIIATLIDWQLALISLMLVIPLLLWSFSVYGARIVPRVQHVQELEWRSLSIVHESMAMLRVIVSFGREDHEHRRFREQGQDCGRRARQADSRSKPLHPRGADSDRRRHVRWSWASAPGMSSRGRSPSAS